MNNVKILIGSIRERGILTTIRKLIDFARACGFGGSSGNIRIYWYHNSKNPNFGDLLNPWLVQKLTGKNALRANHLCFKKHYVIIGSVLDKANRFACVWGAGGKPTSKDLDVRAVRGPLTRRRLIERKIECPPIYGDPGLLAPLFYFPNEKKIYDLGIIPHVTELAIVQEWYVQDSSVLIIDVQQPVEKVIKDMLSCRRTLSSSLHGIIISHAYRIPAAWAIFLPESNDKTSIGTGKFVDYFLSVGVLGPFLPIISGEEKIDTKTLLAISKERQTIPEVSRIRKAQRELIESCPLNIQRKDDVLTRL